MVEKSSHYEYLATYVDDILICSKEPMAAIKSLEKIYLLKNVGIPEYHLGENIELTYIQNVIPKFEHLFGKQFNSIKTPMSEGYHQLTAM